MANQQKLEQQLIEAAEGGDLETVRRSVQRENVNVEARKESGWRALMEASRRGHKEIVELLLDNDANVNAANPYGSTALHWASMKGHKEVVEM